MNIMDLVTSIPVRVHLDESISPLLEEVRERIARRAYQNFVERGYIHGNDLDDWLEAEREIIIKPVPVISRSGEDLIVEFTLPEIDLPNLAVHVGPRRLAVSSDVDEGLQVCQVIDLPCEISMDGVDAEQTRDTIRIAAALA
jgi:hypothetical protein